MNKELKDAIHRFDLINKSNAQLADWRIIRKELMSTQPTSTNKAQDAIELLAKVNKQLFNNSSEKCGELRCGSHLHSEINSIVAAQQHLA